MTKTNRALLLSAVSLILCASMLIGSTYAWFTDSASSASNVIQSGNLDIQVEYTLDGKTWADLDGADDLFQKGLWEPGHTEVVALRIKNNGSLALKYAASMNIVDETIGKTKDGEDIVLSDILTVTTVCQEANMVGDILLGMVFNGSQNTDTSNTKAFKSSNILASDQELFAGAAHYVIITVDMAETVGNEANHDGVNVPSIHFGIKVLATQYTSESDSFGNQYDADASLEEHFNISNDEELDEALRNGGKGTVINEINGAMGKLPEGNELVLDLNGQVVNGGTVASGDVDGGEAAFENSGKLTIKNGTVNSDYITVDNKKGTLKLDDLTLNTTDLLYGFYVRSGEVTLDDVNINAIRGGLNIKGGKVTINGGSVTVKGKNSKTGYHFYAAGESTEVVINGGEYTYNNGYRNYGMIYADGASVVINGGTFGKGGSSYSTKWIQAVNGGTVTIYGGSFAFDPSNFVAEGYEAVQGADGWWTVSHVAG